MEKEIVSNASSLIFIEKAKIFNLVKNLYSRILVPERVLKEIFKYNRPENIVIEQEINSGFIKLIKVRGVKDFPIHIGEKEAISLCLEKNIFLFLSDDKKARRYARSLKIETIGVLGVIINNLKLKHINKREARALMEKLIKEGYYMDPELYAEVMKIGDFY
ncbi:MAG: DUF3368 domain-containing protein [Nanoarchaeota archaeon]|nr:DUF3368 domain-containing protein [Nanoarchaeota archaeon]